MDVDDRGLEKIRQCIREYELRKEKERRSIEEKNHQQEEKKRQAVQKYDLWFKRFGDKARKAADVIWDWYKKFLTTQSFHELTVALGEHEGEICISRIISCEEPHKDFLGDIIYRQQLTLDLAGNLFVHNCTKYGKAHLLRQKEDLLRFVVTTVLIGVADTIDDGTIWDLIEVR